MSKRSSIRHMNAPLPSDPAAAGDDGKGDATRTPATGGELPTDETSKPPSILKSILASLYYISVSVCLTIFNKMLFARTQAVHPAILLFCQSLTAILVLNIAATFNHITLPKLNILVSTPSVKAYAPLYFTQLAMLLTSLLALKLTSLLMYNTLRRTSIMFVVALHALQTHTRPTFATITAAVIVTLGAIYASRADLAFDATGYSLALCANLVTSFYLVLVRPVRDKLSVSNIQLVYLNAVANLPTLFLIILILQPSASQLLQSLITSPELSFLFLASCALSTVINHAVFLNTTVNDPVAQSIAAQLKDVVLLFLSVAFIDDPAKRAHGNVQGALTGFVGSVVYAIGKLYTRWTDSRASTTARAPHPQPQHATPDDQAQLVRPPSQT